MTQAIRTRAYGLAYSFCPNHTSIIEALARAKLSGREFRVVLLIMRQTDGYLRGTDQISPSFFAAKTGIPKAHISNALARLRTWGVIAVSPGHPPFYSVQPPGQWAPEALTENGEPMIQDSPKTVNDSPKTVNGLTKFGEKQIRPIDNTKDNSLKMWDSILSEIRNQVTPSVYDTWFEGTSGQAQSGVMIIDAPNSQVATTLQDRFRSMITGTIRQLTGTEMPIQIRHRRKP